MIRLPDHITEAEVLALIEGDMGSLPHERREIVREAVARDPVLSKIVGDIKGDASAVVAMSRVTAPPAIRARVIEDLSRPAPRPELVREPEGGQIPVSSVIITNVSPFRRFLEKAPVRRFVAAASLMLVAGLGLWAAIAVVRSAEEWGKSRSIAVLPAPPISSGVPTSDPDPLVITDGVAIAHAPDSDPAATAETDPAGPSPAPSPAIAVAAVQPAPAASQGMPIAQAIELARAGRLVIRVRAVNITDFEKDINQLALANANETRWRPLESWERQQVARALGRPPAMPYAADKPLSKPTVTLPEEPTKPPQKIGPVGTAADIAGALRDADFRPLFTVEMDETEHDLAALIERLATDKTQAVEFVALEEPLPTVIPSTDPAAVLWWSLPPSEWTRRVSVPIVLEKKS